jgi:hypothetical protein
VHTIRDKVCICTLLNKYWKWALQFQSTPASPSQMIVFICAWKLVNIPEEIITGLETYPGTTGRPVGTHSMYRVPTKGISYGGRYVKCRRGFEVATNKGS